MKKSLTLLSVLLFCLILPACNKPVDNNNGQYSLKGGLSITLPQEQFGNIREVPLDNDAILKQYQQIYPAVSKIETAMYDNFGAYNPLGFSYAYTKANTNIFETDTPFGFDNVQDITISGKNCKRSETLDREMNRILTMVSCKHGRQSWDIFFQTFLPPQDTSNSPQQNKQTVMQVAQDIKLASQAILDNAINSIQII